MPQFSRLHLATDCSGIRSIKDTKDSLRTTDFFLFFLSGIIWDQSMQQETEGWSNELSLCRATDNIPAATSFCGQKRSVVVRRVSSVCQGEEREVYPTTSF